MLCTRHLDNECRHKTHQMGIDYVASNHAVQFTAHRNLAKGITRKFADAYTSP